MTDDKLEQDCMQLPLDANGEPIHVGDKVRYQSWISSKLITVCGVSPTRVYAWIKTDSDLVIQEFPSGFCCHEESETVDSILNGLVREAQGWTIFDEPVNIESYVERIKKVMAES